MPSVDFLLTSLVVVCIPGTGVLYTVSTGILRGFRPAAAAALGCTAGIIPHLAASVLGLSAMMHLSATTFTIIRFAGACYLLYLAWSTWRDHGESQFTGVQNSGSFWRIASQGVLLNILNPKLTLFFLAFLPHFLNPQGAVSPRAELLFLSLVFMAMTLCVFLLYGACAHGARAHLLSHPRRIRFLQRTFATMFGLLGIKLMVTEQ